MFTRWESDRMAQEAKDAIKREKERNQRLKIEAEVKKMRELERKYQGGPSVFGTELPSSYYDNVRTPGPPKRKKVSPSFRISYGVTERLNAIEK